MAPAGLYTTSTHMQITDSNPPPTRPLDVLFYIGLGVVAVMLLWFSIYMSAKIYVLLGGSRSWLCCCMRRRGTPPCLTMRAGDEDAARLPTPNFAARYHPYLDSPDSEGSSTPGSKVQGLGIDFGGASPITTLDKHVGSAIDSAEILGPDAGAHRRNAETYDNPTSHASPRINSSESWSPIGIAK